MSETNTLVLPFGEAVQTSLGLILVEIDPEYHADEDGNVENRFAPGTPVNFLIHHDPAMVIKRVRETEYGHISDRGVVQRSGKKGLATFTDPEGEVSLSHIPAAKPSATRWYGRASAIVWSAGENKITAPAAPCLGDIAYSYKTRSFRYTPPAMSLAVEEEYPVDMVIEYGEAS